MKADGVKRKTHAVLADALRDRILSGELAEGERLPYEDDSFDACFTVGGFNYFGDHDETLREMRRVTRPGGPLVVADEAPWLHRCGIGHLIGQPRIDAAWLRLSRLGPACALHARNDDEPWRFVRHFPLASTSGLRAGFLAQSPAGEGATARFEAIAFTPERLADLRSGV